MGGGRTRRVFLEEFIKAELKPTWFITVSFEQEWNWTKGGFTVCCEVLWGGLNVESAAENWRHISLVLIPMVPIKSPRRKWNVGRLLFQSVLHFFFEAAKTVWMDESKRKKRRMKVGSSLPDIITPTDVLIVLSLLCGAITSLAMRVIFYANGTLSLSPPR